MSAIVAAGRRRRGGPHVRVALLLFAGSIVVASRVLPTDALAPPPPPLISGRPSAFAVPGRCDDRAASFLPFQGVSSGLPSFHRRKRSLRQSSSLSLFPADVPSILPADVASNSFPSFLIGIEDVETTTSAAKALAEGLGYLIGAASILLYTPIAVRILRTKTADGLTVSTWWLKLTSFTCTDVYNIRNSFPIAAFSETLVITLEAALVLGLVTYYQKRVDIMTYLMTAAYLAVTAWALLSPFDRLPWGPPDEWISFAQVLATVLNTSALLPQLKQNLDRQSSGDYSPITASLASVGCTVRLFTTMELAGGDPLLLLNYGVALVLNLSVLSQVLYYGTRNEGRTLAALFLADVRSHEEEEEEVVMKVIEDVMLVDEVIEEELGRMTTLSR